MMATIEKRKSKLGRRLLFALLIVVALCALTVVYNNHSFGQISRNEFDARLDHAIDAATEWMVHNQEFEGNPPMMFMVGDMARMSGDPRLQKIVAGYLAGSRVRIPGQPITWYYARMADPQAPVPVLRNEELPAVGWQNRWNAYAMAPDKVQITEDDRADLFSPTKYNWGTRLHIQLLALDMYRAFNGPSVDLNQAINPVSEGVANDGYWDFRVNDAYYQRTAFLLGAGRPDLVRSRWVDRILDHQRANGSWNYCWYGWCRGILEFKFYEFNTAHPTVQTAWALYMLKYRYADWISQHYH